MTKHKIKMIKGSDCQSDDIDIHTVLISIAQAIEEAFEDNLSKPVEFFLVIRTPMDKGEEGVGIISNNNSDHMKLIEILRSRLDILESQVKKSNNELN